ncbi:hypothetical protein [Luteimonas changyuni]|uniref:hypothetical protein n=1 Tax=Luteimonas sp. MJ145 TaxID=3129234 RepID=UPI0031BA1EE3
MSAMRLLAALASLAVLAGYPLLMTRYPGFTLLSPRGGVVMQGISLLIANAGIWLAGYKGLSPAMRFQCAAAGWIWILVQAGGGIYMYVAGG